MLDISDALDLLSAVGLMTLADQADEKAKAASGIDSNTEEIWYGVKTGFVCQAALEHKDELEIGEDKGMISVSVSLPNGRLLRHHLLKKPTAKYIRGNGFDPAVRFRLLQMFGIKPTKQDQLAAREGRDSPRRSRHRHCAT